MAFFKLNSIKIPHNKHTAGLAPVRMPHPAVVTLPMSMHIGAPAVPVVKAGDTVKVGQKVADAGGFVSSPIYSGVSGVVKKIDEVLLSNGSKCPAVIIESDGRGEVFEGITPPEVTDMASFISAVAQSGVVGLGGAGFPSHVKLNVKDVGQIEHVVINCAECEGYITSDTRTMLDKSDEIFEGIELLRRFFGDKRFVLGIESNKKECIDKLTPMAKAHSVEIKVLPSVYPMGGEKVLVYYTTGRVIPEGKLPLDVGAVVINCTTLTSINQYVKTGMPLVEKTVTVAGSAVNEEKNVIVPVGTSIKDLVEFCGGYKEEPQKILYGGPMMGISVCSDECPVLKNTNAILVFGKKETAAEQSGECINCGRCVSHCPMRLMPTMINSAFEKKDIDRLKKLKVTVCMECGCCSYVCPAKRPLVQTNKLAKAMLKQASAK